MPARWAGALASRNSWNVIGASWHWQLAAGRGVAPSAAPSSRRWFAGSSRESAGARSGVARIGPGGLELLDVIRRGQPGRLVHEAEILGLPACDLCVHPIDGDPPDVPEGPGARAVGVEEKHGPGVSGRDLEVETRDVVLVDALEAHRERNVPKPPSRDIGDERGRDFGRFAEIEQRPVALSRRASSTRLPMGQLPPASFKSSGAKRVMPVPAPAVETVSGAGSDETVRANSASVGARLRWTVGSALAAAPVFGSAGAAGERGEREEQTRTSLPRRVAPAGADGRGSCRPASPRRTSGTFAEPSTTASRLGTSRPVVLDTLRLDRMAVAVPGRRVEE